MTKDELEKEIHHASIHLIRCEDELELCKQELREADKIFWDAVETLSSYRKQLREIV